MNITLANTEPYYRFHRFSEEFNRNVRISVAGLGYVRKLQRTASGPVALPSDGEPFGKNQWNNPGKEVPAAKGFVAAMGVANIVTILEDCCVGVQAEHSRWTALQGKTVLQQPQSEDDAEGLSPKALYRQLRNCIVHRSGKANAEITRYAAGARLKSCVEGWSGPRKKRLPALPVVVLGEYVPLLPRHAVLACEVSRRIAIDMNARLLDYLGDEGVVYMAAYHSLLSKRPIASSARRSGQAMLNTILTGRYRVKLTERTEAVHVLSEIGKWRPYLRKFERLHN